MRTQQGSLFKSHGAWYVRYREHGKKNPVAHRLVSLTEYPKKSEVIPLKNEFMDRLNRIGFTSEVGVSIGVGHNLGHRLDEASLRRAHIFMNQLEARIARAAGVQQVAVN
jgi:hypothetical protein